MSEIERFQGKVEADLQHVGRRLDQLRELVDRQLDNRNAHNLQNAEQLARLESRLDAMATQVRALIADIDRIHERLQNRTDAMGTLSGLVRVEEGEVRLSKGRAAAIGGGGMVGAVTLWELLGRLAEWISRASSAGPPS